MELKQTNRWSHVKLTDAAKENRTAAAKEHEHQEPSNTHRGSRTRYINRAKASADIELMKKLIWS